MRFCALLPEIDHPRERCWKFIFFDEADLKDGAVVKVCSLDAVFLDKEARVSFDLPCWPGFCCLGCTLFLAGGRMLTEYEDVDVDLLLSFDPTAATQSECSTCSWRISGVMRHKQQICVPVPYDGKIFIFGLDSSTEIYDPQLGNCLQPMHLPKKLDLGVPNSYFLWKDSRKASEKPLIVLYCGYHRGGHQLHSYDVEEERWELFDGNFPEPPPDRGIWIRNLIPLPFSNTLLLIDRAALWSAYNLTSKKVVGEVQVQGLKKDHLVVQAFLCGCFDDGSLILYIFMDFLVPWEFYFVEPSTYVPYAKVRL